MSRNSLERVEARFAINVLENSRSELLLLERSKRAKYGPGLWGFPAGHIETGESPEECAMRELEEEIGSRFTIEFIASVGPVRDSYYGGVYEIYLYHHRWLDGEIKLNHEHTRYTWVNRENYRHYRVMDGIDEDIRYFNIWPIEFLNKERLPISETSRSTR